MAKEEWKNTGKELGGAFTGLAKTLIRSAKTTVDNVEEWAENKDDKKDNAPEKPEDPNVFSDGSWKKTGKDLGSAFKSLGKSILGSAEEGAEALSELIDDKKEDEEK